MSEARSWVNTHGAPQMAGSAWQAPCVGFLVACFVGLAESGPSIEQPSPVSYCLVVG